MKKIKYYAELLNGREYGCEITKEESEEMAKQGVVIVYGESDDRMEFRGAIDDEVGCFDGGRAYLSRNGLFENKCCEDCCPYAKAEREKCMKIDAVWVKDGYSWVYETDIPHECFDIVEDDGAKYCRGIVFELSEAGE